MLNTQNNARGFSLLELLMVVAIIALLVTVVISYLSSARARGADASVKSNLATIRSVAEIFFLDNANSYLPAGGSNFGIATCPVYSPSGTNILSKDPVIAAAIAEATKQGSGNSCYNSSNSWAVAVGLKTNPGTSWCVDNSGRAREVASVPAGAINSSTFACN